MNKLSIFLFLITQMFTLYSMENICSAENQEKLETTYLDQIPSEINQRIILSIFFNRDNITELINDLLNLEKLSTEWSSFLQNEKLLKIGFSIFFKRILYFSKLSKFEFEVQKSDEFLNTVRQKLTTTGVSDSEFKNFFTLGLLIKQKEFWKKLFKDFFRKILSNSNINELKLHVDRCKKLIKKSTKISTETDFNHNWREIISIFRSVFEDVRLNFEIKKAIYEEFKFDLAKELINECKKNQNSHLWKHGLIAITLMAYSVKPRCKEYKAYVENFIKFLINEINVDVSERGLEGMTPLMRATSLGLNRTFDSLVKKDILEDKSNLGWTPLFYAASSGQIEIVKKLISLGANVLAKDRKGATVLMRACAGANIKVVEELLNTQAVEQINEQDENGWTALMIASREMFASTEGYLHRKIINMLIDNRADANIENKDGETTLQILVTGAQYRIDKLKKIREDRKWKKFSCNTISKKEEIEEK